MSLPSQTSTFRSGVHTRLALSSAFSPTLNPRCLEGNFAPAWISTLNDATAFSDRFSVETEPIISIPGNFVQDLELDAQSEEMLNRRHLLVSLMEQDEETAVPDPSGTILRKSLRLKNTKDITKQWRETEIKKLDEALAIKSSGSHLQEGGDDFEDGKHSNQPLVISDVVIVSMISLQRQIYRTKRQQ